MRKAPTGAASRSRKTPVARSALKQEAALGVEALGGLLREAALGVLVQAADRVAQQRPGAACRIPILRGAQRLLERGLEAVEELVHPRLQPLVLADQRVAGHHAHHSWVLLGEREQHLDQLVGLAAAVGFVLGDAVGERSEVHTSELQSPMY